jgi:hypothetical protein
MKNALNTIGFHEVSYKETEDRGQRSEDRGQKSDGRVLNSECGSGEKKKVRR